MLEVFRRPPQQKSIGNVSLRQIRIHLKRAPAVKFGLLQPGSRRIVFEVSRSTDERKRGVSQRKSRIARDRVREVCCSFVQKRGIAGGAEPITVHEFRIGQGIVAVTRASLTDGWTQGPV